MKELKMCELNETDIKQVNGGVPTLIVGWFFGKMMDYALENSGEHGNWLHNEGEFRRSKI